MDFDANGGEEALYDSFHQDPLSAMLDSSEPPVTMTMVKAGKISAIYCWAQVAETLDREYYTNLGWKNHGIAIPEIGKFKDLYISADRLTLIRVCIDREEYYSVELDDPYNP